MMVSKGFCGRWREQKIFIIAIEGQLGTRARAFYSEGWSIHYCNSAIGWFDSLAGAEAIKPLCLCVGRSIAYSAIIDKNVKELDKQRRKDHDKKAT